MLHFTLIENCANYTTNGADKLADSQDILQWISASRFSFLKSGETLTTPTIPKVGLDSLRLLIYLNDHQIGNVRGSIFPSIFFPGVFNLLSGLQATKR